MRWRQRRCGVGVASGMPERIRGRRGVKHREQVRREEPLCRMCLAKGRVTPTQEIDHIIPLRQGGTNDRDNLAGLCREHHLEKSTGYKRQRIGQDGWPIED